MLDFDSVDKRYTRTEIDLKYILEFYYNHSIRSNTELIYFGFPAADAKDVKDWNKALSKIVAIEIEPKVVNTMVHQLKNIGFHTGRRFVFEEDFVEIMENSTISLLEKENLKGKALDKYEDVAKQLEEFSSAFQSQLSDTRKKRSKKLDYKFNIVHLDFTGTIIGKKKNHGMKQFFQFQKQRDTKNFLLMVTFYVTERGVSIQKGISGYLKVFHGYLREILENIETEGNVANIEKMELILNELEALVGEEYEDSISQLKSFIKFFRSGILELLAIAKKYQSGSSCLRAVIVIPYLIAHFASAVGYKCECKDLVIYRGKSEGSVMFHGIFNVSYENDAVNQGVNRLIYHNYDFPLKNHKVIHARNGLISEFPWDEEVRKILDLFPVKNNLLSIIKPNNNKICKALIKILLPAHTDTLRNFSDITPVRTLSGDNQIFCYDLDSSFEKIFVYVTYSLTNDDYNLVLEDFEKEKMDLPFYFLCAVINEPLARNKKKKSTKNYPDGLKHLLSFRGFFCKKCGNDLNQTEFVKYSRYGRNGLYFCYDCLAVELIESCLSYKKLEYKKLNKSKNIKWKITKIRENTENFRDLENRKCYLYIIEIFDELGENREALGKFLVYVVHCLTKNVYDIIKKHHSSQQEPLEDYILCEGKEEIIGGLKKPVNLTIKSIQNPE